MADLTPELRALLRERAEAVRPASKGRPVFSASYMLLVLDALDEAEGVRRG